MRIGVQSFSFACRLVKFKITIQALPSKVKSQGKIILGKTIQKVFNCFAFNSFAF